MAIAPLSFYQQGLTSVWIIMIAKVEGVEVDRLTFAPPQPTNRDVVFTTLEPVTHTIEIRSSPDGVALGTIVAEFVYDVKNQQIIGERRFYTVGGIGANDPAAGTRDIIDTYLDGKNVDGVFREGFRYLEEGPEYTLIAGGGVHMEEATMSTFNDGERVIVEISYLTDFVPPLPKSLFASVITLTANTTLTAGTHANRKMKCAASGAQLVITLPQVSTMTDGDYLWFSSFTGNQKQTKFITQLGAQIEGFGTEFSMGKYEVFWLEKRTDHFEVFDCSAVAAFLMVGEIVKPGFKDQSNLLLEDGALYDGDDYPRPWYYIKNILPVSHYIIDDAVTGGGYVHPVGKEGLFVIHSTLKKFRMPNTQGWSERGLKNFSTYGTDAKRVYDYPGGTMPEELGPHFHDEAVQNQASPSDGTFPSFNRSATGHSVRRWNTTNGLDTGQLCTTDINRSLVTPYAYTTENTVKNVGRIYARRI